MGMKRHNQTFLSNFMVPITQTPTHFQKIPEKLIQKEFDRPAFDLFLKDRGD
jgi:hypothetical protein